MAMDQVGTAGDAMLDEQVEAHTLGVDHGYWRDRLVQRRCFEWVSDSGWSEMGMESSWVRRARVVKSTLLRQQKTRPIDISVREMCCAYEFVDLCSPRCDGRQTLTRGGPDCRNILRSKQCLEELFMSPASLFLLSLGRARLNGGANKELGSVLGRSRRMIINNIKSDYSSSIFTPKCLRV